MEQSSSPSANPHKKLRVLMLHGFAQSACVFKSKTEGLRKQLESQIPPAPAPGSIVQCPGGIEFYFTTAPIELSLTDIPEAVFSPEERARSPLDAYGWWQRREADDGQPFYEGLDRALQSIALELEQNGPFEGIIGFSQGGTAAAMVASSLESGRQNHFSTAQLAGAMPFPHRSTHPPLRFVIACSGSKVDEDPSYAAFYEPKIATPVYHLLGSMDKVNNETRSLALVEACLVGRGNPDGASRVSYHPGGHILPVDPAQHATALAEFIRESISV
jgi:predicted esterase